MSGIEKMNSPCTLPPAGLYEPVCYFSVRLVVCSVPAFTEGGTGQPQRWKGMEKLRAAVPHTATRGYHLTDAEQFTTLLNAAMMVGASTKEKASRFCLKEKNTT